MESSWFLWNDLKRLPDSTRRAPVQRRADVLWPTEDWCVLFIPSMRRGEKERGASPAPRSALTHQNAASCLVFLSIAMETAWLATFGEHLYALSAAGKGRPLSVLRRTFLIFYFFKWFQMFYLKKKWRLGLNLIIHTSFWLLHSLSKCQNFLTFPTKQIWFKMVWSFPYFPPSTHSFPIFIPQMTFSQ